MKTDTYLSLYSSCSPGGGRRSELRSDVSGKLVRYTVEEGGRVEAGQPFAEAEAMKMIITLKATESARKDLAESREQQRTLQGTSGRSKETYF